MRTVDEIYDEVYQFSDELVRRTFEEIEDRCTRVMKLIRNFSRLARKKIEQSYISNYGYVLFRLF